jgi:GNAT superfamily N-acetyltransferase
VEWCREKYATTEGAWFMEPPVMKELNRMLEQHGYEIDQLHPFFLSFREGSARTGAYQIRWYRDGEIEVFRGDTRFSNAYSFCPTAPDRIGVGAFRDGKLLGMAGASADSPDLWQIGIDVLPEARGGGIGVMLVSLLRNEILREGKVPFYGAAVSHAISQSIAVRAGFVPAWAELTTRRIPV